MGLNESYNSGIMLFFSFKLYQISICGTNLHPLLESILK